MKADDQDQLLRELLPGKELSAFRQESLALGLAALQRRRQRRQIFRASAAAILVLLVASGLLWQLTRSPATQRRPVSPEFARAPLPSNTPSATLISDDELLALFPNRSLALIGKPGHQRLLFLDEEVKR
jgi:hypothetical protein